MKDLHRPEFFAQIMEANERYWQSYIYDELRKFPRFLLALTTAARPLDWLTISLNCARCLRGTDLAEIENAFVREGLVPSIWTDPLTPPAMVEKLGQSGYREVEAEREVWRVFDLAQLPAGRGTGAIEIAAVDPKGDPESLHAGLAIVERCYGMPRPLIDQIGRKLGEIDPTVTKGMLLAKVAGVPAGVVCYGIVDSIAFLSLRGTLPEFRRQGLMTVVEQERFRRLREAGCRYAAGAILAQNAAGLAAKHGVPHHDLFECRLWGR